MCFQFILEDLFELIYFRPDNDAAIRVVVFVIVKVSLVIVFGSVKFCEGNDLSYDRIVKCAAFIQLRFILFSFLFLLFIVIEDSTAVLCADVIALPVECSRVVSLPENFQ